MKLHVDEKKQAKVENYISNYSIDFNQLLKLLDHGICGKIKKPHISYAFDNGNYTGFPGKDIYFALEWMTDEQQNIVAEKLAGCFPYKPPTDHVEFSACVRYLHGLFDKNGCLLSEDSKLLISHLDFDRSDKFVEKLKNSFITKKCDYGLVLYYEMKGHRIGDRILLGDYSLVDKMIKYYHQSHQLALKIKSIKHIFTSYYWCARYLENINPKLAIMHHEMNLKLMESYCPDTREGYVDKAKDSIEYLLKKLQGKELSEFKRWILQCHNKCITKLHKLVK